MNKLLILLSVFIFVGCTVKTDYTKPDNRSTSNVVRYEVPQDGVVCYRIFSYDGISCLKVK